MTGSGGFPGGVEDSGIGPGGVRPGGGVAPVPDPGIPPGIGADSVARVEAGGLGLAGKLGVEALDLVDAAARHTAAFGIADVDTRHLLWAATQQGPTRALLARMGLDPDGVAEQAGEPVPAGEPLESALGLSPSCKRALLDSDRISRARGAETIGPEHLLIALAENRDSTAGRILAATGAADPVAVAAAASAMPTPAADNAHAVTASPAAATT